MVRLTCLLACADKQTDAGLRRPQVLVFFAFQPSSDLTHKPRLLCFARYEKHDYMSAVYSCLGAMARFSRDPPSGVVVTPIRGCGLHLRSRSPPKLIPS